MRIMWKTAGGLMRVDWRRVLAVELALLAGCALTYVAWLVVQRVFHTIMVLVFATILSFALSPIVNRIERQVGRRGVAVPLVYLGVLVLVIGGLALLTSPFVTQSSALLTELPRYADALKAQS